MARTDDRKTTARPVSRATLWGLLAAFLVALGVVWAVIWTLDLEPQLGLDLEGGISITLVPAPGQEVTDDAVDVAVEVLRSRVDALGVAEPDLARQGDNIMVQLPGETDQQQAEDVIAETAVLQFRRVTDIVPPGDADYDDAGPPCDEIDERFATEGPPPDDEEVVLCESAAGAEDEDVDQELTADERAKYVLGPTEVGGDQLEDAAAGLDEAGLQWQVNLSFDSDGASRFADVTADLACAPLGSTDRQFAIVLDGRVESAPQMAETVQCGVGIPGGRATITTAGEQEARDLAIVLRGGALPLQLDIETSQIVSPTLGRSSLIGGLQAGFLGLGLVALYLIGLYRGIGVAAVLELAVFGAVVYGLIVLMGELVGFTLTLAGIAGVVVSIGIAADSSIIYRERYRDEIRAGRTIRSAADEAWRRAFRTNLTGNTVSFLAALVLYFLAVGPVRGFAFTLGMSTLIDTLLFATFTRGLFGVIARNRKLARSPWMGLRADVVAPTLITADGRPAPTLAGEADLPVGAASGDDERGDGDRGDDRDRSADQPAGSDPSRRS